MKHIPALRCLVPVVDSRFHRLLQKQDSKCLKEKHPLSSDGIYIKFINNINKYVVKYTHGSLGRKT